MTELFDPADNGCQHDWVTLGTPVWLIRYCKECLWHQKRVKTQRGTVRHYRQHVWTRFI